MERENLWTVERVAGMKQLIEQIRNGAIINDDTLHIYDFLNKPCYELWDNPKSEKPTIKILVARSQSDVTYWENEGIRNSIICMENDPLWHFILND